MKKLVRIAVIGLGILLLIALALPFLIDANTYRPALESRLSQSLGREVKFGDLRLAIFSGGVSASDLSIAEDPAFGKTPFVHAKSLKVGVELIPLIFSHKLNVTGITIDSPDVQLTQNAAGEWNFSSLGGKAPAKSKPAEPAESGGGKPMEISIRSVKIAGGRIALNKGALEDLNLELRDFSATTATAFSLSCKIAGGGEIQLDGKAGPLAQANAETTPFQAALKVTALNLSRATATMDGRATLDGAAESNGRTLQIKGKLKAERLRLTRTGQPADRPVELDITLDHNLKTRSGKLAQGDIHIGAATASLTGTYTGTANTTVLRMHFAGPSMPVPDLAALLPAMGIELPAGSALQGGTAAVKLDLEGPTTGLVTVGDIEITKTTLAGFDLGAKMKVIEAIAGIKGGPNTEIETLRSSLRMSPEGIRADGLRLVAPAIGELSGGGLIDPANTLDFKMSAKVHTAGMLGAVSDAPIPFLITGPASDPVFRPDVKAVVSEKAKSVGAKAAKGLLDKYLGGGASRR